MLKILGSTLLAAGVLSMAAAPALALTVTNRADKAHEVTVDLGTEEPKTTIEAGASKKLECPDGCEVRVTGMGYGLAAKDGEKVAIGQNGMLAYDEATTEARNETGGASGAKSKAD
jgi:hypothetical protein